MQGAMMSNPTPNYLKVAYWVYGKKDFVLGHEIAEYFNLSNKELRLYFNYMVSNADVMKVKSIRMECELTSLYFVVSITQSVLDKIQQDPTAALLNIKGKAQVQCEKKTQKLWSLALGVRQRISSAYL